MRPELNPWRTCHIRKPNSKLLGLLSPLPHGCIGLWRGNLCYLLPSGGDVEEGSLLLMQSADWLLSMEEGHVQLLRWLESCSPLGHAIHM